MWNVRLSEAMGVSMTSNIRTDAIIKGLLIFCSNKRFTHLSCTLEIGH